MGLSQLTPEEMVIVGECLRAAAYGPFFDDAEFEVLFCVTRKEAQSVADRFPDIDEFDDEQVSNDDCWLIINNSLANLTGYPHGMGQEWSKFISSTPHQVAEVFKKWLS